MKVWEKMLKDEYSRFERMRKEIDANEIKMVDAITLFAETGRCRDMDCDRCPFNIECSAHNLQNGKILNKEYLKEKLTREVEE